MAKGSRLMRQQGPGRNDPCPCGSGKKYKKCHGLPRTAPQRGLIDDKAYTHFLIISQDLKNYVTDTQGRALIFRDRQLAQACVARTYPRDTMGTHGFTPDRWKLFCEQRRVRLIDTRAEFDQVIDELRARIRATAEQAHEPSDPTAAAETVRNVSAVPGGGEGEAPSDAQPAPEACEQRHGDALEPDPAGQSVPSMG